MADNGIQKSGHQGDIKRKQEDSHAPTLSACADLSQPGAHPGAQRAPDKAAVSLPSLAIEADKPKTDAVAAELRRTLLGVKSWVYPEAVLDKLRDAHPTDAAKFEASFNKFEGGNLRDELRAHLNPSDYRTAIAILENREDEKRMADDVQVALHNPNGSSPDAIALMTMMSSMDAKQLSQFEQNFPKNVGDDLTLRGELQKYLGNGPDYKRFVAMLDAATAKQDMSDITGSIPSTHSSMKEWIDALGTLSKTMCSEGIFKIDPKSINEAAFKQNYAREAVRAGQQFGFSPAQVKDIATSIFAYEEDGWGTSYTTPNMTPRMLAPDLQSTLLDHRPPSSAVGYNQLTKKVTMELLNKHGNGIAERLTELAAALPANDPHAHLLAAKARFISAISPLVDPDAPQPPAGMTSKQLGEAAQALNMDPDVGPLLQVEQLKSLFAWYTKPEKPGTMTKKELLQQATARINDSATAFDHLTDPQRKAAVDRIMAMVQPRPEDAKLAAQLAAKLHASFRPKLATQLHLNNDEQRLLTTAQRGSEALPATDATRLLFSKLAVMKFGKLTPDKLLPSMMEFANFSGRGGAEGMLRHPLDPASKYLNTNALKINFVPANATGQTLLTDMYAAIQEKRKYPYRGNTEMRSAFERPPHH
jgi:hypothetical protein